MKLLFLLDEIYAPHGPTLRFGRALAAQAAQRGHAVTILENVPGPRALFTDADGVRRLQFCDTREHALYSAVKGWRAAGLGLCGMLLRALARPRLLVYAFWLLVLKRSPLEAAFRRRLRAAFAENPFDAAVPVCAPHYTAFALAGSGLPCVKAAYMADPFTAAATMRHISSKTREKALYAALDIAFITDIMARQNLYPSQYAAKTAALHFPALRRPKVLPCGDDIVLDSAYTNCVFVGNLYLGIREPGFALTLFEQLPQNIRLVLVGGGFDQFPPAFTEGWRRRLGARLAVYPPVSQQAAFNAMQRADVLVSIGNSDASQLPSKVFDYLSCGAPVLNLCKLESCPTRPFFDEYPLALSLLEAGEPSPQQVRRATAFIEENVGRRIPFEEIEPRYRGYTPAAVAQKLLGAVQSAVAVRKYGKGGGRP